MTPGDFVSFVYGISDKVNFDRERLILGGDHLGPLTWQDKNESEAMEKAAELVAAFVKAGFSKIHIDTSMKLADDKAGPLSGSVIAKRGAALARASEEACRQTGTRLPVYIIGSEVPIPGGAQEEEPALSVTRPEDLTATIDSFRKEYDALGLESAWERVVAVVVQPGVEFGDNAVFEYERDKAKALVATLEYYPNIVFEGHSTDYQTKQKLREMVQDSVAILKVGPALTFALREALFALNNIERILLQGTGVHFSDFESVLEVAMLKNPNGWRKYYHNSLDKLTLQRKFSFSDRCRYYLPDKTVEDSIKRLIKNLNNIKIPVTLLSQFMPVQYLKVREGLLQNDAESLLKDRVVSCLNEYDYATG